jgi:hypothetical protein
MTKPVFPVSALLQLEMMLNVGDSKLSPLDLLVGLRLNLLAVCAIFKALPSGSATLTRTLAAAFAAYLSRDFVNLIVEEEEGLLPHLNRRLMLGDDLDDVISQLSDEHRQDREQAKILAARCSDFAAGTDEDWPELCEALAHFAEKQRRHLTWEDATILPMARNRLSGEDLNHWGAKMQRRYHLISSQTR